MDTFDVVVIGGGAAGMAAALSAAGAGARVALVRRGPGAAALAAGGWHEPPPAPLRAALAGAGLEIRPCDGPLPHPDGMLVRSAVAAESHACASIGADSRDVIVCGIAGLPSFHAPALAALWADEAGLPGGAIHQASLTLADTPPAGWSPVSLAALLEKAPERLGSAISAAARGRGATRAIVPAVLGLNEHARVFTAVQDTAGLALGEALGVAPSVPGWRLDTALKRAAADAGVHIIAGSVVSGESRAGRVFGISVRSRVGVTDIGARCFVLATGKYIGGGITAGLEFEESAIGCDVALERFARTIDDPAASLMLTDPVRTEPQPVLSAGVRVDGDGRPLTPSGDVFLSNVFVAGSVRAGVETGALGLGGAAHDGWAAGQRAAALSAAG